MVIEKEIIIEKNISQAWQVLGPQFADAYKWASAVHHSEGTGAGLNGSSCSERGCSTTMGALRERLLNYAPGTYELEYEVAEGMPQMVKYATNHWQLTDLGGGKTRLKIQMAFEFRGALSFLMKPMMRMKLSKIGTELTEDFKYYVENGQPHPRKVKAVAKQKVSS